MAEKIAFRPNGLDTLVEHFHNASPSEQAAALSRLPVAEAARLARRMTAYGLARAARHLDREVYRAIERRLPADQRRRLRHLLTLPEKAVGAWQHDGFAVVTAGVPAAVAARQKLGGDTGHLYVVAGDGAYLGRVPKERLAGGADQGAVETVVDRVEPANELDERGRVARRMQRRGITELPVVDGAGRLTGVVRAPEIAGKDLLTRVAKVTGGWYGARAGGSGTATVTGIVAVAVVAMAAAVIW